MQPKVRLSIWGKKCLDDAAFREIYFFKGKRAAKKKKKKRRDDKKYDGFEINTRDHSTFRKNHHLSRSSSRGWVTRGDSFSSLLRECWRHSLYYYKTKALYFGENDVLLLYHHARDHTLHHLCPIRENHRRGEMARPTTKPPPPVWSTKKRDDDDDDNNNNNNMYERAEYVGRWEGQGIGRRHRRGSRDRVRRRRSERPRGGVPRIEPDRSRGETVRGEQRARERGRDAFGMHDVVWHRSRVDGCRDDGRADGERESERCVRY